MARKASKKEPTVYFTDEELAAMTPEQKLKRIVDLESEIAGQKGRLKDIQGSTRDLITEMEAKKQVLLDSTKK